MWRPSVIRNRLRTGSFACFLLVVLFLVVRTVLVYETGLTERSQAQIEAYYLIQAKAGAENEYAFRVHPIQLMFEWFGESVFAARVPGLVCLALSSLLMLPIAERVAGKEKRKYGPLVFLLIPWVEVWYPKAMPEPFLGLGIVAVMAGASMAHKNAVLGWGLVALGFWVSIESKPVGVLSAFGVVFAKGWWTWFKGVALGLFAWDFLGQQGFNVVELFQRTRGRVNAQTLFHNERSVEFRPEETLMSVLVLGLGLFVFIALLSQTLYSLVVNLVWGTYAVWDSIPHHSYYGLPLAIAVGTVVPRRINRRNLEVVLVLMLFWNFMVLAWSGGLGDRQLELIRSFPEGADVTGFNWGGTQYPVEWYRPDLEPREEAEWGFGKVVPEGCRAFGERAYLTDVMYVWKCGA